MNERQQIDIDKLVVDEENPRFEAVSTEDDALYSILADQQPKTGTNKVLNLARDIAEHGLNASESLIVSPIEGTDTYLVREGNRRVSAIKLSLHSERVPEDFNSLASHFAELASAMQGHRSIECYVCDDEEEIRRLLLLRHGGESNGVGTVKWNSTQTARFSDEGNTQSARALSLLDDLRQKFGNGDLWTKAALIPATNLGRLISTPEVRQALGIAVEGNNAWYLGGHDDLLLDLLETIRTKGVKIIFYKDDRLRLVEEAAERVEPDGQRQAQLDFDEPTDDDFSGMHEPEQEPETKTNSHERPSAHDNPEHGHGSSGVDAQPASNPWVDGAQAEQEQPNEAGRSSAQTEEEQPGEDAQVGARRRKPVRNSANKPMFGHVLNPKDPESNTVYRGIDWIDSQYFKLDENRQATLLPILGFSLRLLMETVARKYYEAHEDDRGDNALRDFLKDVAKPAIKDKLDAVGRNNLALASEWINGIYNFEGLFAKWAHGTLAVDRAALVRQSELVALIIDEIWT